MSYKIKKNHEKLRMKNGGGGPYLKDSDGKLILVSDIKRIDLWSQWGSHTVVAVMKNGNSKDLFGCSDHEHSKKEFEEYKKDFEFKKKIK